MLGNPLCLGLAHSRQGALPKPAGSDPGVEFAERDDAGRRQLVGRSVFKPARVQVAILRLLGGHSFEAMEEGELARAQALAASGLAVRREALLVDLQAPRPRRGRRSVRWRTYPVWVVRRQWS